jgi:hypothetical protein
MRAVAYSLRSSDLADDHHAAFPTVLIGNHFAEYLRVSRPIETPSTLRQIFQFCASRQPWLPAICFVAG